MRPSSPGSTGRIYPVPRPPAPEALPARNRWSGDAGLARMRRVARLGLDLTWLRPDRLSGTERYALELVPALAALAPGELVLFVRPDLPPGLAALDVERRVATIRGRVALDQGWLPWAALRARVDLLHSLA